MNKIAKIVLAIALSAAAASSAYVIRRNSEEGTILRNKALKANVDRHVEAEKKDEL